MHIHYNDSYEHTLALETQPRGHDIYSFGIDPFLVIIGIYLINCLSNTQ